MEEKEVRNHVEQFSHVCHGCGTCYFHKKAMKKINRENLVKQQENVCPDIKWFKPREMTINDKERLINILSG